MASAEIALRIERVSQLFDVLDPAPFREKSLDTSAEAYITEAAGALPPDAEIELVFIGPEHLEHELTAVADAVRGHFEYRIQQERQRWRWRARIARRATALGFAILGAAIALRGALGLSESPVFDVMSEGLLIFGWVALWRPIEHLLFDRVEHRAKCQLLGRLATVGIGYRPPPGSD